MAVFHYDGLRELAKCHQVAFSKQPLGEGNVRNCEGLTVFHSTPGSLGVEHGGFVLLTGLLLPFQKGVGLGTAQGFALQQSI